MGVFTEEFSKRFGNKYQFLQLYNVVFNTTENEVTITFLYDEFVPEITDEQRKEIDDFFKEKLNTYAPIRVKFRKSFLDISLIDKEVLNILKAQFQSSVGEITLDNIKIEKDGKDVAVTLLCNKMVADFLNNRGAEKILEKELAKEFIAHFIVRIKIDNNIQIDLAILDERELSAHSQFLEPKVRVNRYAVDDVFMLFGNEITPRPEFIKEVKSEKTNVIFSGLILNFQKKNYVKKKEKAKGENAKQSAYYTFTLKDNGGQINCTYFSSVANEKKMDKLCDNTRVITLGNVERFNGNLTYYIKAIGFCSEPRIIKSTPKLVETENFDFVRPYIEKQQANIFDIKPSYSDNIISNSFVVYDFETTGLDTNTCDIIEIGAAKIVNGEIKEIFQTLVKPKDPVSDLITNLTGISNEMLESSPNIKVVLPAFKKFCDGCVLCGYNSSMFDDKILNVQARKLENEFDNPTQDVLVLARSKMSSSNYKLGTVVKNLGIVLIDAHRALNDAIATAKVFLKLNEVK